MRRSLVGCELFQGLEDEALSRLQSVAERESFRAGEQLFVLGQEADRLFVVITGTVDLCLPLSIQGTVNDVRLDSKGPCSAIGWSAFVSPYRFRLSARAAEDCELAAFPRGDLMKILDEDPRIGYVFVGHVARVIGERLLTMEALWVRELQRALSSGAEPQAATGGERHETGVVSPPHGS